MKIVHYYAGLFDVRSGVTMATADWARAQSDDGHEVVLLGAGSVADAEQDFPSGVRVLSVPHRGRRRMTRVPVGLGSLLEGADFLYLHEGWTTSHYAAALQARRAGVPYIVMPHGVYEPEWASMMKALRPRRALERQLLKHAAAAHLFFESERRNPSAVHPGTRAFVAPTGTVLPSREWTGGRPELLWIGRYSTAHKGLDLLLQALASVPADTRPLLLMRGTDYRGGKAEVEGLVSSLGLAGHVTVGPPVGGEEKESLLLECAGYVQPSRWESHSIGLLEALSRATPSLISDRMPISADVAAAGAALVSPLEPAELGRQLVTLAAGQPELGAVGRRFVAEHFDWKPVMVHYEQELAALC